jgi:hypothetical protein
MKRAAILASLIGAATIGTANAAIMETHLGSLSDGATGLIGNFFTTADTFSDTFSFTLPALSTFSASTMSSGLTDVFWTISSDNNTVFSGPFSNGEYTFGNLAPGAYTASVFGNSSINSGYFVQYAVTAVPEAETWLMILMGLGLIGYQLRRKHNLLRQQALPNGEGRDAPAMPSFPQMALQA